MKHIISLVPYLEVSENLYRFLKREYDWIREGRPESIAEDLDFLWARLNEEDMAFTSQRGLIDDDDLTWQKGNGFQYAMLDAVPELV